MTTAKVSKKLFIDGVRKSYEWAGWVLIVMSAMMGIPPFYVVTRRLLDGMFGLLQLPSNLAWFLSQLTWGGAILACGFAVVMTIRSSLGLLQKFALLATAAFVATTIYGFGSASALSLMLAIAILLFAAATWWMVQTKQLAPFLIFRSKQSAERLAADIDREDVKAPTGHKRSAQIRAAAMVNSSTAKQLADACTLALAAYVVEAGVNLAAWIPDPIATLFRLFQGLFIGTFWQELSPIVYQLIWIGLTCALTEIAAVQLVGTERISALLKVDGAGGDGKQSEAPKQQQPAQAQRPIQQPGPQHPVQHPSQAAAQASRSQQILDAFRNAS